MTTLALSWVDAARVHVLELGSGQRVVIGRSPDAQVVIDHPSVSRHHAALIVGQAGAGAVHVVQHLSRTNPTLLDGRPVDESANIADGGVITVGQASLTFHDLASRDRLSGPVCHKCGRENELSGRDCWFCGTSLLNAPTTIRHPRPVVCRVVSAAGLWADLYAQHTILLNADGTPAVIRGGGTDGQARIVERDGHPVYLSGSATSAEDEDGGHALGTGAVIEAEGAAYSVICRPAPAG